MVFKLDIDSIFYMYIFIVCERNPVYINEIIFIFIINHLVWRWYEKQLCEKTLRNETLSRNSESCHFVFRQWTAEQRPVTSVRIACLVPFDLELWNLDSVNKAVWNIEWKPWFSDS